MKMRHRNKTFSSSLLSLLLLVTAGSGTGQDKWVDMVSDDGGVAFSIPSKYLVYRETGKVSIFATSPEGEFTVTSEEVDSARRRVKRYPAMFGGSTKSEVEEGKEYFIRKYEFEKAASFSGAVHYGTRDTLVELSFISDRSTNPSIQRFLSSIGLSLSSNYRGANGAVASRIQLSSLSTSQAVLDGLNAPDAPASAVTFGPVADEVPLFDNRYSRRLLVLSKPSAPYTDQARMVHTQGTILAKVEFLASGQIGSIVVDRKLDRGLAVNVGNAARRLKFVPAEIGGKPIDVVRVLKYTFSIYH